MKFTWLAAAGLLAFASPALAQEAPPPVASAPATQPVDPERMALARQLMDVIGGKAMLKSMYGTVLSAIPRPENLTPDQQSRMEQLVSSMAVGLDATTPEMVELLVDIYARNLTAQEMRDALAFYRTPSGQAMLKKSPALMQLAMKQAALEMQRSAPKIWAAAHVDYCKHRTCDKLDEEMFRHIEAADGAPPKPAS